jgi:hypothetical protein
MLLHINRKFTMGKFKSSLHGADFIQGFLKKKEKKLARSFNFTFRYIDDVLSLTNSRFGDFVDRISVSENYCFIMNIDKKNHD